MISLNAKQKSVHSDLPKSVIALIARKKFSIEDDEMESEVLKGERFHIFTERKKFYFADREGSTYYIFEITQDKFNELRYSHKVVPYEASPLMQTALKLQGYNNKLRRSIDRDAKLIKEIREQQEQAHFTSGLMTLITRQKFENDYKSVKRIIAQLNIHRKYRINYRQHTLDFLDDFRVVTNHMLELRDSGKEDDIPGYLSESIRLLEETWGIDFHDNPIQELQDKTRYIRAKIIDFKSVKPKPYTGKNPADGSAQILKFSTIKKPRTRSL